MAVLHKKEEKIQAVLGRLPKKFSDEDFVNMFIKLFSKDWGKIKAAYIKQSQDKEPGTVINMPKPNLYLKQIADAYVKAHPPKVEALKEEALVAPAKKAKTISKKTVETEPVITEAKTKKAPAKKKVADSEAPIVAIKKTKTPTKKKESD